MDDSTMYTVTNSDAGVGAALAGFGMLAFVLALVAYVATSLGLMQFFKKAGQPGWAAWVPLYNYYVMNKVAGIPMYWFWIFVASIFLAWLPVIGSLVTLVAAVYITYKFLEKFGKDIGHTVLAVLFPFVYFPVVGYSKELTYNRVAQTEPPTTPNA